ncbi:inheritance of peroxisomes protein 1-domain-containing protein [Nemania sp. FL0916]|nr:inheritance of peroxisomes protein 1-domain-containing protein [Nemania sp. FL0916]
MASPRLAPGRPDILQPRRVVTEPVPPSASPPPRPKNSSPQASPSGTEELVETLYSHPSVRIINFTSSRHGFVSPRPAHLDNDGAPGSLPPSSHLERTIAAGAFRIYRAPGSVAFLSCGSALQPILPKSQCWCLDEDNRRFVLQIRRPQYWRIELPVAEQEDVLRAALFREVLDKILLFEKTECPFQRSFTVQLPDAPETPIKKRAWTVEGKNLISSPFESDLSPPADLPRALNRGDGATNFTRGLPGFGAGSVAAAGLRYEDYTLGDSEQSFGEDVWDSRIRNQTDALRGMDPADSRALSSRGYDPVGASDRDAVGSLVSPEATSQGPAVFPGPSSSSLDAEVPQRLGLSALKSRLREIEVLHGEGSTHPTKPSVRSTVGKNDEPQQPRSLFYFDENEGYTDAHMWRTGDEPEARSRRAARMRESLRAADKMANTTVTEIQEKRTQSNQQVEVVSEPDHQINENDAASFEGSGHVAPVNLARKRMTRMLAGRSYTAPPQLTLVVTSKSNERTAARRTSQPQQSPVALRSPSASTDSFHSVQSWSSSVTPPPESPHSGESPALPSQAPHSPSHDDTPKETTRDIPGSSVGSDSRDDAELTPRPAHAVEHDHSKECIDRETSPRASQLPAVEDRPRARQRSHAGSLSVRRRTLSPLPPAANLFSPPPRQTSQSRLAAIRRLPAAIVHKTLEILLSPPSHLVNLMLKVAAKIVAGEWRGLVFGFDEAGEQIPVQWDYYSDGEFSDLSDSDDYTLATQASNYSGSVPRIDARRRTRHSQDSHQDSCEID